ncbi:Ger(x)C family spore germination protein [Anaerosporomusa subterranea]|nr:Ger(x)C family spore germination protein [Anaerosporomusa subterranea]
MLTSKRCEPKQLCAIGLLIVLCMILTGCWDQRELQDRGFVLASAIDANDESSSSLKQQRIESFAYPHGGSPYRLSLQMLRLGGQTSEEGSKKSNGGKTYVLSNTGHSLFEMARDMWGQSSKALWFEHQQAIIISEAALKHAGLAHFLDFFQRDSEMRWRTRIYITPGKARPLLEYEPPSGEPGGLFFTALSRQYGKDPHLPTFRTDLGFTTFDLDNGSDIILPRIEMVDNDVKVNGAALFKKDRLVGYIDEYAVKGQKYILGMEKSALITFECPLHPGGVTVFELYRHHTVLTPHVEGDSIYFTLDIAMRGNLGEATCALKHNTTGRQYQEDARQMFAQEVKRNIEYGRKTAQDLGVDVLNYSRLLKAKEPKTWEKIKDRWDEIFPTIPLIVSVNITILNVGEHQ